MKTKPDPTAAKRMERLRERKKEQGLTHNCLWCHPEDWPAIQELGKQLTAKRRKGQR